MESLLPPEFRELLQRRSDERVSVNAYKSRFEPLRCEVNGRIGDWHSVKGGLHELKDTNGRERHTEISYEILYNPETNQWLKIVPPEAKDSIRLENRLRQGYIIAKKALEIADLDSLAHQCEEGMVQLRSNSVYGFVSPHIGPSVEYFIRTACNDAPRKYATDALKPFIGDIYTIAFDQAVELFSNYGFWTDDPNPGNIVLHEDHKGIHVTLIDFSNKKQIVEHRHVDNPYMDIRLMLYRKKLENLYSKFKKQCDKYGIPFYEDPEELTKLFDVQQQKFVAREANDTTNILNDFNAIAPK